MTSKRTFNYDHVLIIGNGFDLDLGLPTSYGNFLESSNFHALLNCNNRLAEHLSKTKAQNKWVDIELELARFSKVKFVTAKPNNFRNDYLALCDALETYIDGIDYSQLNRSSRAARLLARLAEENSLCVVNFNYTETIDHLLPQGNKTVKHHRLHIHGSAKLKNIVFGVQDSADIKPNHVFLRKAVSKGFFVECLAGTIMKNAQKSISIYGHSLGETDHTQFEPFFGLANSSKSSNIDIFYNSENGYYNLYQQIEKMTSRRLQAFRTQHNLRMLGPDDDE